MSRNSQQIERASPGTFDRVRRNRAGRAGFAQYRLLYQERRSKSHSDKRLTVVILSVRVADIFELSSIEKKPVRHRRIRLELVEGENTHQVEH